MSNPEASKILNGKLAVVTGASSGIGKEIARGLALQGAEVILACRNISKAEAAKREIQVGAPQARISILQLDLGRLSATRAFAKAFLEKYSKLDILVNKAGGPLFNAPFLEIRPDGWRRVLELNLLSVVGFCRAVGAHMVERSTGSVINIDSIGASHPGQLVSPYCAAKAAVVNLTYVLAQEWGSAGVRVNTVSPGWVRTDINRRIYEQPEAAERIARRVPLGRWGESGDMIGVAVWLASDASSYVTGAHIPIDGGVGVVAPQAPSGPSAERSPAARDR
jgi:NAD(P)-dependent dehydrogenase (short-subunit alcohol dehydrogenase family)